MLSFQKEACLWLSNEASSCGETDQLVSISESQSSKPKEDGISTELSMVVSPGMSWNSLVLSTKSSILSGGGCSEEHVLNCTFEACDPEQTGKVPVFRIIEYLQAMTGQSCEEGRLQSLYKMLDPEERGVAVDLPTFHAVMKDWISDCRRDGGLECTKEQDKFVDDICLLPSGKKRKAAGNAAQLEGYGGDFNTSNLEEAVALASIIEDLECSNKKLAVQNAKLQRTIESAEEINSWLTEEISELKGRLRGMQQALEQAKYIANELEDLKAIEKRLEEENVRLHTQAQQLEKEQQCLSVQVDDLQEENRKLITEREGKRQKIEVLVTEKAELKSQLCEYERVISCKDAALTEKTNWAEELAATVEEYRMVVQEQRLEINRLQDHLCHTYNDSAVLPTEFLDEVKASVKGHANWIPVQPLCVEIEEIQQRTGTDEPYLPSPLCGMLQSSGAHVLALSPVKKSTEMDPVDSMAIAEEQMLAPQIQRHVCMHARVLVSFTPPHQDLEEAKGTKAKLLGTLSLPQWSTLGEAKLQSHEDQQQLTPEGSDREERREQIFPAREESHKHGGEKQVELAQGTRKEKCPPEAYVLPYPEQVVNSNCQEVGHAETIVSRPVESKPGTALEDYARVQNLLGPSRQTEPWNCWLGVLALWLLSALGALLVHPWAHLPHRCLLLGLLSILFLLPVLFCLGPPYRQHLAWTMPRGAAWPYLQLRYLGPPPT
ncbi:protein KASH5 isoform X2 [Alligator mississippiensis]|uniref:protein KASH5 isoform X2 n=1 Tax=Alligator mississippiensis TaxID=8496 RepID=UPI002877ABA9|nr:protein KASH5 isoform X2 [Alligator mississippiensis]